jgi:hypothetical protein
MSTGIKQLRPLMALAAFTFCVHVKPASAAQHRGEPVVPLYHHINPFAQAIEPTPPTAVFKMAGCDLWDPSILHAGRIYYLFASHWPASKGFGYWEHSDVIVATSPRLLGPYTFRHVVLKARPGKWDSRGIANPKILKVGGQYLLYYLGIPKFQTGFAIADSIHGPWKRFNKPVIPTNNPALWIHRNGSAYAVGKAKIRTRPHGSVHDFMQAYAAKNWRGPYKPFGAKPDALPGRFELEDPTLWYANGQYNVIATDWKSKATGIFKAGVYYVSQHGRHYRLVSRIPIFDRFKPFHFSNGSEVRFSRIERPQVVLNKHRQVIALLTAVRHGSGESYILIQAVKNFYPKAFPAQMGTK